MSEDIDDSLTRDRWQPQPHRQLQARLQAEARAAACKHDYNRSLGGHHTEHFSCKICGHEMAYYWPSHEWMNLGVSQERIDELTYG